MSARSALVNLVERRLVRPLRRALGAPGLPVWYHPSYRLPSATIEGRLGLEPRRADFALDALQAAKISDLQTPRRISYAELEAVHTARYLESLHDPRTLARIFAIDQPDVMVDELLTMLRLACGGTLAAARTVLQRGGSAVNLLGGFHHSGPDRGGGLCGMNDMAVAIAAVRRDGLAGKVVIIDLDAHPPDGLSECFANDPSVWIGSLSGCDWGLLPGVDETVIPGANDQVYLEALDAMLRRMPPPELAFVIAGGDVLAGDQLGKLGLTLGGVRRRDVAVARALRGVPTVWLPGGGYHADAWKILVGAALVAAGHPDDEVRPTDPLARQFAHIAGELDPFRLRGSGDNDFGLRTEDVLADLEGRPPEGRLLGYYGAEGIEYALQRYGLLPHVARLGYVDLRVDIDRASVGDRVRVFGRAGVQEYLLVELVVERRLIGGLDTLFVHWLTLRHPRAARTRELLPGQEVPGLGLLRDAVELLERMAARLSLAALAFRPSHYHLAYVGRQRFRFVDPARQGRFEALVRDLAALPLPAATLAVASGRVQLGGARYTWEADDMVDLIATTWDDADKVTEAREAAHFTVVP